MVVIVAVVAGVAVVVVIVAVVVAVAVGVVDLAGVVGVAVVGAVVVGVAVVAVYLGCFRRRLRNGLHSPDGLSFLAAFRRCELGSICLMLDCIVVVDRQLLLQR